MTCVTGLSVTSAIACRYFGPRFGRGSTAMTPLDETTNIVLYSPSVTQYTPPRISWTAYPLAEATAGPAVRPCSMLATRSAASPHTHDRHTVRDTRARVTLKAAPALMRFSNRGATAEATGTAVRSPRRSHWSARAGR